jgi:hypothetical protein
MASEDVHLVSDANFQEAVLTAECLVPVDFWAPSADVAGRPRCGWVYGDLPALDATLPDERV